MLQAGAWLSGSTAIASIGRVVRAPDGYTLSLGPAPEALGAYHKAETEKWWPIIKAANVKPQ